MGSFLPVLCQCCGLRVLLPHKNIEVLIFSAFCSSGIVSTDFFALHWSDLFIDFRENIAKFLDISVCLHLPENCLMCLHFFLKPPIISSYK